MPPTIADDAPLPSRDLAFAGRRGHDRWRAGVAAPVIIAVSLAAWGGLFQLGQLLRGTLG